MVVRTFVLVAALAAALAPGGPGMARTAPSPPTPPGRDVPAGVAAGNGRLVVDPAGNRLLRLGPRGRAWTVAAFPARVLPGPPGRRPVLLESAPSSVVRGPDGAFYVGELTGFPYPPGRARVWRVVPGEAPTVYAAGLTTVADLAWGPGGELYALQTAPRAALLRIDRPGPHRVIASTGLVAPDRLTLGDRVAYVTDAGRAVLPIPLE